MTFANAAELIRLLLRQSDRHPVRAIGAAELEPYLPDQLRAQSLQRSGIIREPRQASAEAALPVIPYWDANAGRNPEMRWRKPTFDIQVVEIPMSTASASLGTISAYREV